MIEKHIAYWEKSAAEDWEVGSSLIHEGRIRHGLFLIHLALEKVLKAHFCQTHKDMAPKIHSLSMASQPIINNLSRYLRLLIEAGIPVDKALLFGSYATGKSTEESDVDLLVISSIFDQSKTGHLLDTLWRLRRKIDSRIEPVAIGKREFEKEWGSPVIDFARHQGIEIKPAPPRNPSQPISLP